VKFRAAFGALIAAGAALTACERPHAFIASTDEKSVQVNFYGDIAEAWPLARQYCGRYQRTPRLSYTDATIGMAVFDCVLR
jgi:hypothetical protein